MQHYLLKYWIMFSIQPIKHSAQHASTASTACGILCCLWDRALFMDFKRWPRRWNWWQFRRVKHRDFSYLGPVSFVVHMALAGLIAFNVLFRHTAYLLLLVTGAALTISALQLILTRTFTRMIMHITLILSICLNMCVLLWIWVNSMKLNLRWICISGVCVYYWTTKYYCMSTTIYIAMKWR